MPVAPDWLSDGAKKAFDECAERLHAAGVLTAVDELALAGRAVHADRLNQQPEDLGPRSMVTTLAKARK